MDVLTLMTTLLKNLLRSSLLFLPLFTLAQRIPVDNSPVDFGLGIRSVVSSDLLSTGTFSAISEDVTFSYAPRPSLGIDAIIRFKLRGRFSLQTGISSIRRGYDVTMDDGSVKFEDYIRLTSFQIPITGILQVPISERGKMGLETGFVLDMLPTDAASGADSFQSFIYVSNRFNAALRATAFFSQDIEKGGRVEIGAGYHRLLGNLGNLYMDFGLPSEVKTFKTPLQGHFFYLGATFFFP